jgi:hypothetical protein
MGFGQEGCAGVRVRGIRKRKMEDGKRREDGKGKKENGK